MSAPNGVCSCWWCGAIGWQFKKVSDDPVAHTCRGHERRPYSREKHVQRLKNYTNPNADRVIADLERELEREEGAKRGRKPNYDKQSAPLPVIE